MLRCLSVPPDRLGFHGGIFLLLLAVAGAGCSRPAEDVVLITIDTLRADHVSSYGYSRATTPELDRFFASGTVFENAISSAPCTLPSVKQLLRGSFEADAESQTLAERLHQRGFVTGAVVSQHQFYKQPDAYRRGFDRFDIQSLDEVDQHGMTPRTAREVSDRAIAWLDEIPSNRPFFLWLHYFDPHDPYEPPAKYRGFDAGNVSARSGDRRTDLEQEKRTTTERARDAGYIFTPKDVQHLINLYDGEILYADSEIGRVLAALDARGITSHALVVLTSDHGERLGRGGHWDHCASLGDEELRVPLFVRVNGGPLTGRARETGQASTLDVVPTLLALLGIPLEAGPAVARDLRKLPDRRTALAFWHGRWAARCADWKLIAGGGGAPPELYEVARDPLEERNLASRGDPAEQDLTRVIEPLAGLGQRIENENSLPIEELRSLGYLE